MSSEAQHPKKVGGKRMKSCKKKTHQTSLDIKGSLARLFFAKSSSHGEEQEQQEKTKK
jgi:hypothetical protein